MVIQETVIHLADVYSKAPVFANTSESQQDLP